MPAAEGATFKANPMVHTHGIESVGADDVSLPILIWSVNESQGRSADDALELF